jgi:hypothetical protein
MLTQEEIVEGILIEGRMIAIFPPLYSGPGAGGGLICENPLLRLVCEGWECIYTNLCGGLRVGRTIYCSPTTTNAYRGFGGSPGSGAVDKAAAAALDALGEAGREAELSKCREAFNLAHSQWITDGKKGNLLDKAPKGTREVWRILVKIANGSTMARRIQEGANALGDDREAFLAVGTGQEAKERQQRMKRRHQGGVL